MLRDPGLESVCDRAGTPEEGDGLDRLPHKQFSTHIAAQCGREGKTSSWSEAKAGHLKGDSTLFVGQPSAGHPPGSLSAPNTARHRELAFNIP